MLAKIDYKKLLLYALAVVAPGGGIVLAGYHVIRFWKSRKQKVEHNVKD